MKVLLLISLLLATQAPAADSRVQPGFDSTHAALTRILSARVRNERVDYAGLKRSPEALRGYLDSLAGISRTEFEAWPRPEQLAFLINLYNASTLQLIVDHYPVKSIRKIGSLVQGPWQKPVVRLWGRLESLDHVEHVLIRPVFKEPRAHFALVCASIGCPPLRPEAYTGALLENQLSDQGRLFLSESSKNRFDPSTRTLHLSPVFQWFASDFEAPGSDIRTFVAPFLPAETRAAVMMPGVKVRYTEYDWSLNSQPQPLPNP